MLKLKAHNWRNFAPREINLLYGMKERDEGK